MFFQVGDSAGAECKAVLQEITNLVDEKLQSDGKSVKKLFGAAKVIVVATLVSSFDKLS